ncbi:MAG TPA: alpha/beta fold hydrolase [Stellaceae bacterium]|nr:alpha/beta fold hydrolase [Stellaceae bacterium]
MTGRGFRPPRRRGAIPTRIVLAVLFLAGLGYGGACLWFVRHEPEFVFHPTRRASVAPAKAGLHGVAEIRLATADGEHLYGWWVPPQPGHGAIVLLPGSGAILSDDAPLFGDLAAHGFGVIGIDYRGNGASSGHPSEAGLRSDARAAFDFAHAAVRQARIAVFGISLGTGIALGLAHDRPVAGVLLDSPYASVLRLFELRGPPLPYRLLMADPLNSQALIGTLHVPVMILHGTDDLTVPIAEARRLYAAAHQPKTMIEVAGAGHAQVWFGGAREAALQALAAWTAP